MPRPKQYTDDATRAAAWRARQEQEQLQATEIARHAERLHHTLKRADVSRDPQEPAKAFPETARTVTFVRYVAASQKISA